MEGKTLSVEEANKKFKLDTRYSFEVTRKVNDKLFEVSFQGSDEQHDLNLTDFLET